MPYVDRRWLNPPESPSTGSAVAYDGPANWGDGDRTVFFEVADCSVKVRLHMCKGDSPEQFATKLRALADTALRFAEHLESADSAHG